MDLKKLLGDTYRDDLTAAEITELLANVSDESEKFKKAFDKSASEIAELKKKIKALQTEDENKAQLEAEEKERMKTELETFRKQAAIAEHKSNFLALGYDDKLATETAEALHNGESAKVFANQKKFLESRESAIKAELLKGTPTPPAGSSESTVYDKAAFKKMSYNERVELKTNNPAEYDRLVKEK